MSKRCLNLSAIGALVLGLLLVADAAPYQELEPREGYVPVYIREGDTPLYKINPKLAEAFNEIDTRNLLESEGDQNSEQKPDLILMSVDGGEPVLIAQSGDQLMSENESAAAPVIAIVPVPESESQDDSDDIAQVSATNDDESIRAEEEGEAPQAEADNASEVEETKEALKELAAILEEKLESTVSEDRSQMNDEQPEPEQAKIDEMTDDHKPEDQATDVSAEDADDFKTKEIDVKSVETEDSDVPEERTPDAVSTDE